MNYAIIKGIPLNSSQGLTVYNDFDVEFRDQFGDY